MRPSGENAKSRQNYACFLLEKVHKSLAFSEITPFSPKTPFSPCVRGRIIRAAAGRVCFVFGRMAGGTGAVGAAGGTAGCSAAGASGGTAAGPALTSGADC